MHNPEPLDFEERCEECAGFCCIALEIPENSEGTLTKTANSVCEYLDLSPAWKGHSCSTYASRRRKGFETCVHYRCHGVGQLVTRVSERNAWILSDSTFAKEAVEFYDLAYRMANYLETLDFTRKTSIFGFGKKKPDEFEITCERIYRKLVETGSVTDEFGNPAKTEAVREWFLEWIRKKSGRAFGFLKILRK